MDYNKSNTWTTARVTHGLQRGKHMDYRNGNRG